VPLDRDPAENGWLRYYYRDWRPTWIGRFFNRYWAWRASRGLAPEIVVSVQTKDRQSGALTERPVVPCDFQGQQYLVSMLGDGSEWVQDVPATGDAALIKRGRTRPVRLTEIQPQERAPILKAWCQVATSGRKHLPVPYYAPLSEFAAIADEYPVFRIDPAQ
jgi:hypothetical protein